MLSTILKMEEMMKAKIDEEKRNKKLLED